MKKILIGLFAILSVGCFVNASVGGGADALIDIVDVWSRDHENDYKERQNELFGEMPENTKRHVFDKIVAGSTKFTRFNLKTKVGLSDSTIKTLLEAQELFKERKGSVAVQRGLNQEADKEKKRALLEKFYQKYGDGMTTERLRKARADIAEKKAEEAEARRKEEQLREERREEEGFATQLMLIRYEELMGEAEREEDPQESERIKQEAHLIRVALEAGMIPQEFLR